MIFLKGYHIYLAQFSKDIIIIIIDMNERKSEFESFKFVNSLSPIDQYVWVFRILVPCPTNMYKTYKTLIELKNMIRIENLEQKKYLFTSDKGASPFKGAYLDNIILHASLTNLKVGAPRPRMRVRRQAKFYFITKNLLCSQ